MTKDIYSILEDLSIPFERIDHPPVYTSEEARREIPRQDAASAKNLFLRDKKGKRHFLLIADDQKSIDFKYLEDQIGTSRLSLASAARLEKYLSISPGAVSLLALINDPDHAIEVLIDRALWEENAIQFHPLVNTATLIISTPNIEKFLKYTGHEVQFIHIK